MARAVFIQNPESIYDDAHGLHYHFPRQYLGMVEETVGDWVVFYEGRRGVAAYTHVQKVTSVRADLRREGHFYADLDRGSMLDFERPVPRLAANGSPFERRLPPSGGLNASAVRRLTDAEFDAIAAAGLHRMDGPDAMPRIDGFGEGPVPPLLGATLSGFRSEVLTSRAFRDAAFARMVKRAYRSRCAISGLELRNGGGRPEVQAAHIRPVKDGGPDVVRNGLALSGTLHWMFDRGLVAVAEDHRILVSHNKVPREVADRLIAPGQRLLLPDDPRDRPHPEYLRFHREEVFGHGDPL